MYDRGLYGQRLGNTFHLKKVTGFITRRLCECEIAVTEIKYDAENNGLTNPIPSEDALVVALQLRACLRHELWIDNKPVKTEPFEAGMTCFYDLRHNLVANVISPFHSLHFYLPRRALNLMADRGDLPHVADYIIYPGRAVNDQTIRALGYSLLPSFERPDEASQMFVDHVCLAVAAHVLGKYTLAQISA